MALVLPDVWTWDMWFADDGEHFHAFFLKASRALGDPGRRHFNVTVGHAISKDLRVWDEVEDALIKSDADAFDDLSTWTGSIVRVGDGSWRLFYTGTSSAEGGAVQRIGTARSTDLYRWTKDSTAPLSEADPRWYEKLECEVWFDEAWRDPWVFHDGSTWHMLITARASRGPTLERGVIGHAVSSDLDRWETRPPLSAVGGGFGQLEVPQLAEIDGRRVLIFSCLRNEMSAARLGDDDAGGIWTVAVDDLTGPYPIHAATRLTDESLYAGRLIRDRAGQWNLIAFHNTDSAGRFVGAMSDPMPVAWAADGTLRLVDGSFDHLRRRAVEHR
jgi:beta-fructofuranosidase